MAWAAFIFFMSSRSDSNLGSGGSIISVIYQALHAWQDQVLGPEIDIVSPFAHFCEFAIFGALLGYALGWKRRSWMLFWIAVAIASAYGASDELHQLFVPGRMADPADWLVDTCGAALGAWLMTMFLRRRSRKFRLEG